tara:strand:- start:559627 stop:560391 length:765 start_codon:yes stop_codon:yes gene_type:complete
LNEDQSPPEHPDDADRDDDSDRVTQTDAGQGVDTDESTLQDEGPGWMPAILAATLLMGIIGFIACGFTTWLLFQKRAELALRTIEASYIPQVEQSRLQPEEKRDVVDQLKEFAKGLERGDHEDWQAAAVMQRLVRLPVIQWGELRVVEAFLDREGTEEARAGLIELARLRRAVELGDVTSFDVEDVLKPVYKSDDSAAGRKLIDPLTSEAVADVINRAKLLSDRSDVSDDWSDDVSLAEIVRSEIEKGLTEGGF